CSRFSVCFVFITGCLLVHPPAADRIRPSSASDAQTASTPPPAQSHIAAAAPNLACAEYAVRLLHRTLPVVTLPPQRQSTAPIRSHILRAPIRSSLAYQRFSRASLPVDARSDPDNPASGLPCATAPKA